MFGVAIPTILTILLWLILLIILWKQRLPWLSAIRRRMVGVLGALLVIAAYFFQSWIELQFLEYVVKVPAVLKDLLPAEIIDLLVNKIGGDWLSTAVKTFRSLLSLGGWQTSLILLIQGRFSSLFTFAPLFLAGITLFALIPLGVIFCGRKITQVGGAVLAVISLALCLGLMLSFPDIDAAGIHGSLSFLVLSALLGLQMGNGPWITVLGLILLAINGVAETVDTYQPADLALEEGYIE